MARRPIVTKPSAPLADVQAKTESDETFQLLVRDIPDQVNVDFAELKMKLKAKGIKTLKNGSRISLSGYMKQALLESLERDLNNGE
ncbi:hypothetical protein L1D52_24180 [Vibrio brasiliensis]|uniref:hypothetical protein n=1 Tax=Vibrio brasiliensis TaxID=170652 RepID=UPI001EFD7CAF|nr:hypothetical protein [Vibrio brasiliensis]MCG9785411.1 hypothetical protein [Vibrio brasiliensis]